MFKHILVPTDGSELSEQTVVRAVSFAADAKATITFFYAQANAPLPVFGEGALIDPTPPEQYAEQARAEASRILTKAQEVARSRGVTALTDSRVSDLPYEAIIDAADRHGCDLIFMASHGRSGIAALLLGSETQKVLTHSRVPVLVYR